jgi:hypothetical protein
VCASHEHQALSSSSSVGSLAVPKSSRVIRRAIFWWMELKTSMSRKREEIGSRNHHDSGTTVSNTYHGGSAPSDKIVSHGRPSSYSARVARLTSALSFENTLWRLTFAGRNSRSDGLIGPSTSTSQQHPPLQDSQKRPLSAKEGAISKRLSLHSIRLLWLLWLNTRPATLAHCRKPRWRHPSSLLWLAARPQIADILRPESRILQKQGRVSVSAMLS